MSTSTCEHIVYIYIYREREREREKSSSSLCMYKCIEREGESLAHVIHIYIYMYMKGEAIEELHMQMDGVRREGQIERKRNLEEGVREERGIYI